MMSNLKTTLLRIVTSSLLLISSLEGFENTAIAGKITLPNAPVKVFPVGSASN
jgi:hypothetical protein